MTSCGLFKPPKREDESTTSPPPQDYVELILTEKLPPGNYSLIVGDNQESWKISEFSKQRGEQTLKVKKDTLENYVDKVARDGGVVRIEVREQNTGRLIEVVAVDVDNMEVVRLDSVTYAITEVLKEVLKQEGVMNPALSKVKEELEKVLK